MTKGATWEWIPPFPRPAWQALGISAEVAYSYWIRGYSAARAEKERR